MKFIVSSTLLLSHLQTISRVINSKNSMAILDNFLLRSRRNSIVYDSIGSGDDYDYGYRCNGSRGRGCFRCQCENIARTVERVCPINH